MKTIKMIRQPANVMLQQMVPPAQTSQGILNSIGALVSNSSESDTPYTFSNAFKQNFYLGTGEVNINNIPLDLLTEFNIPLMTLPVEGAIPSVLLPFSNSVYSDYTFKMTLWIIKPPMVTGRLMVTWIPYVDNPKYANIPDTTYRSISKEWDLSATDQFDFEVSAPMVQSARKHNGLLTYSPSIGAKVNDNSYNFWMGKFKITVAHRLQIGSIFPDTFKFHAFGTFVDGNVYTQIGGGIYIQDFFFVNT